MKYQLPCEACGKPTIVETSQAGQQIQCACGARIEVPSLRGIRELAPAEAADSQRKRKSWTPGRGVSFAAGLVLIILGILPAAYGAYVRGQLDLSKPPPVDVALIAEDTSQLTMEQTLAVFQEAQRSGLGPYITPPHVAMRQFSKMMGIVSLVGCGMIVAGVIALGGAMLSRGKPRPK